MELKVALYRAKSWLRHQLTAWNTGGEGVHSPYLFEWVRMVMMDKNAYYIWGEIERCREKMLRDERELEFVDYGSAIKSRSLENGSEAAYSLEFRDVRRVCDIARRSLAKRKYAQMLSRLVNWLGSPLLTSPSRGGIGDETLEDRKGLTIVELGTSLGVTTAYMAAMDSRNRVVTFEGCEAVANIAKENWKALNINNIECRVGEIDAEQLTRDIEHLDVAFIDANHTYVSTCEYFDVLAGKVREKSVIVVDDIHYSEEMEKAWKAICADERVTSTIDLYQMGLVFFDKHYWKRHYTMRL
ncbi:MAG: class I SAM-dependent methyltransferase [Paludibacteraceae bacterium]|nr:class I SAM-dependent methyltransferase [Paludibacteraceae bacterium]